MSEEVEQPAAPESAAAPEAASATPEQVESTEAGLLDEPTTEEVQTPEVEDDSEEVEYEGKKFKAPPGIKDALLRQADYTRKTQEVAEQRKAIELQAQEVQRAAQIQQQNIAEIAKVVSIEDRLRQFAQLDWDAITQADPVQAMKLERQMRSLEAEKAQIAQSIAQKQQAEAFNRQQTEAKRIEEGRRELERAIKGWSPELAGKLNETAKSIGYQQEELSQISDPRAIKLLHKAYLYDQLVAQRTAKPAATPAAPVTRITPKASTAVTDPDKMTSSEWVKWRESNLAKQRN